MNIISKKSTNINSTFLLLSFDAKVFYFILFITEVWLFVKIIFLNIFY